MCGGGPLSLGKDELSGFLLTFSDSTLVAGRESLGVCVCVESVRTDVHCGAECSSLPDEGGSLRSSVGLCWLGWSLIFVRFG